MIRTVELTTLTAAGTSTAYDVIAGEMLGAYVLHNTAGTMTLSSVGDVNVTFLTLTSGGTQWYYPRTTAMDSSGAIVASGGTVATELVPFVGRVRVVTNAAGTAAVTAIVRT